VLEAIEDNEGDARMQLAAVQELRQPLTKLSITKAAYSDGSSVRPGPPAPTARGRVLSARRVLGIGGARLLNTDHAK
jgi:hypothetical protein